MHSLTSDPAMDQLRDGARALGLRLTAEHIAAFRTYYLKLVEWNSKFNLTAVTGYEDVQIKHFLDSLACLLAIPAPGIAVGEPLPDVVPLSTAEAPRLCIDVGTGAGFPGLPLKILRPALQMTLVDSSQKKVRFLEHLVPALGLSEVDCRWGRAEELGQDPHFRERYDIVLARAVADLAELAEYCLPLCRKGGCFIASKGADVVAEIELASAAIRLLGGELHEVKTYELPGLKDPRSLVVIEKVGVTPARYPRRPGMAHKRPLSAD